MGLPAPDSLHLALPLPTATPVMLLPLHPERPPCSGFQSQHQADQWPQGLFTVFGNQVNSLGAPDFEVLCAPSFNDFQVRRQLVNKSCF